MEREYPNLASEVVAALTVPRLTFSDDQVCLLKMQAALRIPCMFTSGVFWTHGLHAAITEAIARGPKYVLTVDYDTVFGPEDVIELHRIMEANPECPALVSLQMRREHQSPLFTYGEDGKPNGLIAHERMKADTIPIISGHFGLTMLRVSALEQLPKPWFLEIPDGDGNWTENHPIKPRCDADAYFWRKLNECGMVPCLAPGVVVGHVELMVTWPGPSLGPVHQKCTNYQTAGRPTDGIFSKQGLCEASAPAAVGAVQEGRDSGADNAGAGGPPRQDEVRG
jgi:hypothetical protein